MNAIKNMVHHLNEEELKLLANLREKRSQIKVRPAFRFGDRVADRVAAVMGSWSFIIIQSVLLIIWIVLNVIVYLRHWDPYPFILLNLALSF